MKKGIINLFIIFPKKGEKIANFYKIAAVSDIPEGKIKEYDIKGQKIAVAKASGSLHAFSAYCTHAECSLAGGFLDKNEVTCYCHGAMFDISSGKVLAPPASKPLKIYKLKIEEKDILIEL